MASGNKVSVSSLGTSPGGWPCCRHITICRETVPRPPPSSPSVIPPPTPGPPVYTRGFKWLCHPESSISRRICFLAQPPLPRRFQLLGGAQPLNSFMEFPPAAAQTWVFLQPSTETSNRRRRLSRTQELLNEGRTRLLWCVRGAVCNCHYL